MEQVDFDKFLQSKEFQEEEMDDVYLQLWHLLRLFLDTQTFLDVEELLHEEILRKLELGFRYGYAYGQKTAKKQKKGEKGTKPEEMQ